MSDRPSARRRGRTALLRPSGIAAVIGSLSAAVAFLAVAGSAQAKPTVDLTAGPMLAVGQATTIPAGAVRLGAQSSTRLMQLNVVLQPRDPAALANYATEVATPGSPIYHEYLPKGAFASVFGPAKATIAAVSASLRALGLHPGKVSPSHLAIPVTGTAGQVERALHTTLANYRLPGGRIAFANTSAPRLPAAIAPYVQAVFGLDDVLRMQPLMTKPTSKTVGRVTGTSPGPSVQTGGPQPCRSAKQAQAQIYSKNDKKAWVLTADQMANDYEFSPLYHSGDFGKGQTIGIIELGEPNLPSDVAAYQKCYGTHAKVSYQNIDHFKQTGAGEGEAALDIETVIAMAPKANVVVYRGPSSNNGWYDTFATAAFEDQAKVESVSYGLCEAVFPHSLASALAVVYEQQAVQGQTVVISSGDTGSEGCLRVESGKPGLLSAEFPSSDPDVLAVGGTSIISPNPTKREEELVWNDGFDQDGAGGGGESTFFPEPQYQTSYPGVNSGGSRAVPDVSADADPETGYLIAWKGGWLQVGGTSAAAPLWAALLTLTNDKCTSSTLGFVNPTMYYVASSHVKAVVLNDIVQDSRYTGNDSNDYTGDGGGNYQVTDGYDMATGLGTPIGGALATQLCKYSYDPKGYWLASADGHVYAFHAPYDGSLAGKHLASKVVAIAGDPHTNGYYLVTAKGAVTGFHAPSHGSAHNPAAPILGIAVDTAGTGYWLVTAKGHVYAFGTPSLGSVSGSLASPVVGIATDPFTDGYWVVTKNGKVYPFNAATIAGASLSKVTAIAADPANEGYWLTTATGKVYAFNVGWTPGNMPIGNDFGSVIGIAADRATGGYWMATTTGIVGAVGAAFHGSHALQSSKDPIVGIASTH